MRLAEDDAGVEEALAARAIHLTRDRVARKYLLINNARDPVD